MTTQGSIYYHHAKSGHGGGNNSSSYTNQVSNQVWTEEDDIMRVIRMAEKTLSNETEATTNAVSLFPREWEILHRQYKCAYCDMSFTLWLNMGRRGCINHVGRFELRKNQWSCCQTEGVRPGIQTGCVSADHRLPKEEDGRGFMTSASVFAIPLMLFILLPEYWTRPVARIEYHPSKQARAILSMANNPLSLFSPVDFSSSQEEKLLRDYIVYISRMDKSTDAD